MASLKTQPTKASVRDFIGSIEHDGKRADSETLLKLMKRVTGKKPVMWGNAIVGFDRYEYKYDSGHSGAFFKTGFSPRKQSLTVYIMPGFGDYEDQLKRLGKHKHSKSCLYINKLADVEVDVLEEIVADSYRWMTSKYG